MRVQTKKVLEFGRQSALGSFTSNSFIRFHDCWVNFNRRLKSLLLFLIAPPPCWYSYQRGGGCRGLSTDQVTHPSPHRKTALLVDKWHMSELPYFQTMQQTALPGTYRWHRPGGRTFIFVRRCSSVSIVTWLAGRSEDRGSIPGSTVVFRPAVGRTQRAVQLVPRIKRLGRESDLSPSSV